MKDPEDLLRNAPRIQPRESLGRKMGALFEEARHVAEPGWFGFRIPAWAAVMACGLCLFIGRNWSPHVQPEPIVNLQEKEDPTHKPAAEAPSSEPEVFVQITHRNLSPFNRTSTPSTSFKTSTWKVSQ